MEKNHLTTTGQEEGFTLIELLVVILIIGILSSIAIPTFLNQRKAAIDAQTLVNARNIAYEADKSFLRSPTMELSSASLPDVKLNIGSQWKISQGDLGFCVKVWNPSGDQHITEAKAATYASSNGGLNKAASGCPAGTDTITATPSPTTPTPVATTPAPIPTLPTPEPTCSTAPEVKWEVLANPGDNINTVLAKPELTGKVLKLPKGVFEVTNFRDASKAIYVPPTVKGICGSGNDTILRIKPNTSTYASTVPAQSEAPATNQLYIIRMNDGVEPQLMSDLWVQGTELGHLYNGVMVGNSKPGTIVQNILITGIPGDAGAPPGETFGLNWWRGSDSITRHSEIDGTRWTGDTYDSRVKGAVTGSSPVGYNFHNNAEIFNLYTHDSSHGMPTFWHSNNAETWNLQSIRNAIGINHEESFGIIHHEPVMHSSKTRRHVNFMSNASDGDLTIIGATNDEWINTTTSGPIGKGKRMLVLTPTNYTGTNSNKIFTPPKILLDGGSAAPYTWAH